MGRAEDKNRQVVEEVGVDGDPKTPSSERDVPMGRVLTLDEMIAAQEKFLDVVGFEREPIQ
jgi:hypothetical protein